MNEGGSAEDSSQYYCDKVGGGAAQVLWPKQGQAGQASCVGPPLGQLSG